MAKKSTKTSKKSNRKKLKPKEPVMTLFDKINLALSNVRIKIIEAPLCIEQITTMPKMMLNSAEAYMDVETAEVWNLMGDEIKLMMIQDSLNSKSD